MIKFDPLPKEESSSEKLALHPCAELTEQARSNRMLRRRVTGLR